MAKKKPRIAPNGAELSSVEDRVVTYMNKHKSITPAEAEEHLHNHRLAATIFDLRKKGYQIDTLRMETTNVYGESCWFGKYVFSKK